MFRLVLKDFYLFKGMNKLIAVWLVFVLIKLNDAPILAVTTIIACVMLVRNALVLDDQNNIDTLFCSLPVKRSTLVMARYLSSWITILVVIGLIVLMTLFYPEKSPAFKDMFLTFFYLTLFFAVFFPFYYRFGVQLKSDPGYIAAAVLVLLFMIVLIGSALIIIFEKIDIFKIKFIYFYLCFIMVLFVATSLKLSIRIFRRKEL